MIKAKRALYERTGTLATLEGFVAYCLLLEGHRDDCYFATWSAHGIEGHAWEVLDQLSQSDTLTFDELHEKTSGRGVTCEVHAADAQELARRGWADDASGKIQLPIKACGGLEENARVSIGRERQAHSQRSWSADE